MVPTNNRVRILLQNNLKIVLREDTNAIVSRNRIRIPHSIFKIETLQSLKLHQLKLNTFLIKPKRPHKQVQARG